jgi:hypothetical protein
MLRKIFMRSVNGSLAGLVMAAILAMMPSHQLPSHEPPSHEPPPLSDQPPSQEAASQLGSFL